METKRELRFVEECDLTAGGVLSKIKARKLIAAWSGETIFLQMQNCDFNW